MSSCCCQPGTWLTWTLTVLLVPEFRRGEDVAGAACKRETVSARSISPGPSPSPAPGRTMCAAAPTVVSVCRSVRLPVRVYYVGGAFEKVRHFMQVCKCRDPPIDCSVRVRCKIQGTFIAGCILLVPKTEDGKVNISRILYFRLGNSRFCFCCLGR